MPFRNPGGFSFFPGGDPDGVVAIGRDGGENRFTLLTALVGALNLSRAAAFRENPDSGFHS